MPTLPSGHNLLVRTDFSDEPAWRTLLVAAAQPPESWTYMYGTAEWPAPFTAVDDPQFDGADWQAVQAAVPSDDEGTSLIFVADRVTFTHPDQPLLVVDVDDAYRRARAAFRCTPARLADIEANLNLSNMDWEDFADSTDDDGIFRGFPE